MKVNPMALQDDITSCLSNR